MLNKLDGHGFQNVGSKAMSGATPADNALAATNYVWTLAGAGITAVLLTM
jgi:hypothetical protein